MENYPWACPRIIPPDFMCWACPSSDIPPSSFFRIHLWSWSSAKTGQIKTPPETYALAGLYLRGTVLLSQILANQVPSTSRSLTTVFGMGTGVSSSVWAPQIFLTIFVKSFFRNLKPTFFLSNIKMTKLRSSRSTISIP